MNDGAREGDEEGRVSCGGRKIAGGGEAAVGDFANDAAEGGVAGEVGRLEVVEMLWESHVIEWRVSREDCEEGVL